MPADRQLGTWVVFCVAADIQLLVAVVSCVSVDTQLSVEMVLLSICVSLRLLMLWHGLMVFPYGMRTYFPRADIYIFARIPLSISGDAANEVNVMSSWADVPLVNRHSVSFLVQFDTNTDIFLAFVSMTDPFSSVKFTNFLKKSIENITYYSYN